MSTDALPKFVRFALVGCVGFCVDAAVLYAAMYGLGAGPYLGRVISYICAATSTWFLNRHFTFTDSRGERLFGEWLRFAAFNSSGGLVNYGVYALCLRLLGQGQPVPLLGVAAGSLAGLVVNYTASRHLVFTRRVSCP